MPLRLISNTHLHLMHLRPDGIDLRFIICQTRNSFILFNSRVIAALHCFRIHGFGWNHACSKVFGISNLSLNSDGSMLNGLAKRFLLFEFFTGNVLNALCIFRWTASTFALFKKCFGIFVTIVNACSVNDEYPVEVSWLASSSELICSKTISSSGF